MLTFALERNETSVLIGMEENACIETIAVHAHVVMDGNLLINSKKQINVSELRIVIYKRSLQQ